MSFWYDSVNNMDNALMSEFSISLIIHTSDGDREISGIFDNPMTLSSISGGGFVSDSKPELFVRDGDALGIEKRSLLTVDNRLWMVVASPESDGSGLTKIVLGAHDGQGSPDVTIRY